MGRDMGLFAGFGTTCFKRKFRWMFTIRNLIGDPLTSNVLPPSKASRPNLQFKELEAQHIHETVFYPGKPDWKPITVTLYDTNIITNPVWSWISRYYNPDRGTLVPSSAQFNVQNPNFKISQATLEMFSGCGGVIEQWTFENVWPQSIEFGELDMGQSEVVTIDLTLRYDRAYISNPNPELEDMSNNDFSPQLNQRPENFTSPTPSNSDLGSLTPSFGF